jgi:hypothetical protein
VASICSSCGSTTFANKQGIVKYNDFSGPAQFHKTNFNFAADYIQCTKCGEIKILDSSYKAMIEADSTHKSKVIHNAEIIIANLLVMVCGLEPPMGDVLTLEEAYKFIGGKKPDATDLHQRNTAPDATNN